MVRCEFLSIWYFYRSSFNRWWCYIRDTQVVSSFQFGIFTEVLSTDGVLPSVGFLLWVPFNLVFLPKFFQLLTSKLHYLFCCEFLSIWYFYRSSFNSTSFFTFHFNVVSSFQFGIFTEVLSTRLLNHIASYLLWVPFNLVFLPKFFQRKRYT